MIEEEEHVVRVILSPMHINRKTGEVKPSAFPVSHLMCKGFSLMRLEKMNNHELQIQADVIAQAASKGDKKQEVHGVMLSKAAALRSIYDEKKRRAFCLFDDPVEASAEAPKNDAHSVAIRSLDQDETEILGLRGQLLEIFGKLIPVDKAHS